MIARSSHAHAILTVGHGTLAAEAFSTLLRDQGVRLLVDVRSFPGSRRNPQFRREEMERWIPELTGARYLWVPRLGGFRKSHPHSPNVGLRHVAFRGYADYMETDEFRADLANVLRAAAQTRIVLMCSEAVWWRCHRRLVADAIVLLYGVPVYHLMHDGTLASHRPTDCARVEGNMLRYDGGTLFTTASSARARSS